MVKHEAIGLKPDEMFDRLGIEADLEIYAKSASGPS
jgi:hypothetical protein